MSVSYFQGFKPQEDHDAALKFSLRALFLDERLDDLLALVSDKIGGVEGEPGWIIERGPEESWPEAAFYRAYVDPEHYELKHPEFFCDEVQFNQNASTCLNLYIEQYPQKQAVAQSIKQQIESM